MSEPRALAADAVVLVDEAVVLLERNHSPHEGEWVLPGGLVERGETAEEACVRETREEVGLDVEVVDFVGLYDEPGRDERGNASAAYRCRPTGEEAAPSAGDEAARVATFDPESLPELGFDHERIVSEAVQSGR